MIFTFTFYLLAHKTAPSGLFALLAHNTAPSGLFALLAHNTAPVLTLQQHLRALVASWPHTSTSRALAASGLLPFTSGVPHGA
jgi:hypothetical protein